MVVKVGLHGAPIGGWMDGWIDGLNYGMEYRY